MDGRSPLPRPGGRPPGHLVGRRPSLETAPHRNRASSERCFRRPQAASRDLRQALLVLPDHPPHEAGMLIREESTMSVAHVIEISSTSPQSFEDAIRQGLERANKTLRGVTAAWIKDH